MSHNFLQVKLLKNNYKAIIWHRKCCSCCRLQITLEFSAKMKIWTYSDKSVNTLRAHVPSRQPAHNELFFIISNTGNFFLCAVVIMIQLLVSTKKLGKIVNETFGEHLLHMPTKCLTSKMVMTLQTEPWKFVQMERMLFSFDSHRKVEFCLMLSEKICRWCFVCLH